MYSCKTLHIFVKIGTKLLSLGSFHSIGVQKSREDQQHAFTQNVLRMQCVVFIYFIDFQYSYTILVTILRKKLVTLRMLQSRAI